MSATLPMSEKQLQQAIVDAARALGWLVYHTFDSRKSAAGFPDLCMARHGRVVFAELKDAKREVTAEQWEWLRALEGEGVETYVWRPADWSSGAVERILR